MSETTHDQNESGENWHPAKEVAVDTVEKGEDALLTAVDEVRRQLSTAEMALDDAMESDGTTPEDLLSAKEEVRSFKEVSRLLAEFMPEDGQTVDEWYNRRAQEITDEFDERCAKLEDGTVYHDHTLADAVKSRESYEHDLHTAHGLLTSHFK